MRNVFKSLWIIGCVLCCYGFCGPTAQAQSTTSSITSLHGNTACHRPDTDYAFKFKVTPPNGSTSTRSNGDQVKHTYTVKQVNIREDHGYSALRINGFRYASYSYNNTDQATFTVNYPESWRATKIHLELYANVRYRRTVRRLRDGTLGNEEEEQAYDIPYYSSVSVFELGDYLTDPQTILVDGTAKSEFQVDPTKGCQTYTLSTGPVEGVDRYQWVVTPSSILVSSPSSLTTNTIQVRPTYGNMPSSVRLELIQDCSGSRSKAKTFPIITKRIPVTGSTPLLCAGNLTQYSIPPLEAGVISNWTYDASKLQPFHYQHPNWLTVIPTGDHRSFTNIRVELSSACGTASTTERIWIGTPSIPTTNPSGYPTVQQTHQGFRSYQVVSNHNGQLITGYNWWVTPNNLNLYGSTNPSCIIEGTTLGWHNFYVQLENLCGLSQLGGGAINVGRGGDIPDPKRATPPQKLVGSADGPAVISFSLQPNPADDQVRLQFLDATGSPLKVEDLQIEVLDMKGQLVAKGNKAELEVSELAAGVYVVRVHTGAAWLTQKLVVK